MMFSIPFSKKQFWIGRKLRLSELNYGGCVPVERDSSPDRTVIVMKEGALTQEQILELRNDPRVEIITQEEHSRRINHANKRAFSNYRKELESLGFSERLEWYSKRNAQELVYLGNNQRFQQYWKWRVLLPMRMKRLFYRVKNGEIFKRYKHISEIRQQD